MGDIERGNHVCFETIHINFWTHFLYQFWLQYLKKSYQTTSDLNIKKLRRVKGYMMKPSKTADSKVDWSKWTQWTPALMDEVVVVGPTHSSKVGDTNNNPSYRRRKDRNRRVILFNLPFCKLTHINTVKYFQYFLDRYFNRGNPLRKNVNRNTEKFC